MLVTVNMLSLLASAQLQSGRTSIVRQLCQSLLPAACVSPAHDASKAPFVLPGRSLCTSASTGPPRFAFDIDGVLKRGKEVLHPRLA